MTIMILMIFLCCLLVSSAKHTNFIKMDVNSERTRCVGQQLDEEDIALFSFSAPNTRKSYGKWKPQVFAMIYSPDGEEILERTKIQIGSRPMDIRESIEVRGVYDLCFEVEGNMPVTVSFLIDFRSKKHADELGSSTSKVEKDDMDILERSLISAEEQLQTINDEIALAKEQEHLLKETSDKVNARIEMFSYISIGMLVLTTTYQLYYLRSFFKAKKLL